VTSRKRETRSINLSLEAQLGERKKEQDLLYSFSRIVIALKTLSKTL